MKTPPHYHLHTTPMKESFLCVSCPTLDHAKRRMGQELYYTLRKVKWGSEHSELVSPEGFYSLNP